MDRQGQLGHPGWCVNLVQAGRVQPGEGVLVVVDEPLLEEGSQLVAAVADAGGRPHLELWAGARPLDRAPAPAVAAAQDASLLLFLQQDALGEEGAARFELRDAFTESGGRAIFLGFVDGELLRGEFSEPAVDVSEPARTLLEQLEGAEEVRVRARAGTDLTLRVGGRGWLSDATPLEPGGVANHPGGEVFVAPHADGAEACSWST